MDNHNSKLFLESVQKEDRTRAQVWPFAASLATKEGPVDSQMLVCNAVGSYCGRKLPALETRRASGAWSMSTSVRTPDGVVGSSLMLPFRRDLHLPCLLSSRRSHHGEPPLKDMTITFGTHLTCLTTVGRRTVARQLPPTAEAPLDSRLGAWRRVDRRVGRRLPSPTFTRSWIPRWSNDPLPLSHSYVTFPPNAPKMVI